MPTIYEYFGFVFLFHSNEHAPIHVHVRHSGRENIFELHMQNGKLQQLKVRKKRGVDALTEKERKTAEGFVLKYSSDIIDKWVKYFVMGQDVKKTTITKKI